MFFLHTAWTSYPTKHFWYCPYWKQCKATFVTQNVKFLSQNRKYCGKKRKVDNQHFLFSHYLFKSALYWGCLSLYHTIPLLMTLRRKAFENIVGKGENADNEHFLLFPQYFLLYHREKSSYWKYSNCHLQMFSIWTSLKYVFWSPDSVAKGEWISI